MGTEAESGVQDETLLDLTGEVCPYTFVKSKLALEDLQSGDVLQVIVDNAESASNVPRSLELEGHEIVKLVKSKRAKYEIHVRKA